VRELGRADDDVYPEDHDQQRAYREMVEALDASVGQILAKLEELELAERTLVFFLSDNGAARFGSNLPWRGTKGTLFEGGQRVVAAARWTERIPAGSICDSTLMSFDLVPTLLAVAGVDPPESAAFDGVSFERALVDGVRLPERSLFWAHAGEFAMRQGPWKLLIRSPKRDAYGESQVELYDLSDDPGERVSQTYSKRKLTRAMFDELKQWIGEVGLGPKPEAPARGDGF
jgi:arylsulfatase A-like enzyme